MKKIFVLMLACVIYSSVSIAQDVPYGYRASNGLPSTTFLVQPGFLLDSIVQFNTYANSPQTYRLEYDEQCRVKRDSNFYHGMVEYIPVIINGHKMNKAITLPGLQDYYYNAEGKIDSIRCSYYSILDSTWKSLPGQKYYYSSDGKLISQYYTTGRSKIFIYDSIGNLILTKLYESGVNGDGSYFIIDTVINSYNYDSLKRLVTNKSATFKDSSSGYSLSRYQYDTSGNVTWTSQYIQNMVKYSSFDSLTQSAGDTLYNSYPQVMMYYFDNFGKLVNAKEISPVIIDTVNYSYDSNGNMLGQNSYLKFTYDSNMNLDTFQVYSGNSGYYRGASIVDSYGNRITLDVDYMGSTLIFFYHSTITGIKANTTNAKTLMLSQNYPNPFNPSTVIRYQLANSGMVTLKVYDVLGREVRTLVNERQTAGDHSVTFNAAKLSSGIYFYRLQAGNNIQTKKLVLMK
jgi:hypothetical protein